MPIEFEILPEHALILFRFEGAVSVEENIETFERCADHPRFNGGYHILMNLMNGGFSETYFEDMQRLAHRMLPLYETRSKASRTAVYAPGDIAYGMTRMYMSADNGKAPYDIDVFRNLDEALDYVDVDPVNRPDILARLQG